MCVNPPGQQRVPPGQVQGGAGGVLGGAGGKSRGPQAQRHPLRQPLRLPTRPRQVRHTPAGDDRVTTTTGRQRSERRLGER
eukprot:297047-Prorocentrum_minimum.AAC.1